LLARCGEGPLGNALPESLWTEAITWATDNQRAAFVSVLAASYDGHDPPALAKLAAWARNHDDAASHAKWLGAFADVNHALKLAEEADAAIAEGRQADAIASLQNATKRSGDAMLRQRLVNALIAAGQVDRAAEEAEPLAERCAADRQGPQCRAYRMARGAIATLRGDPRAALDQYRTILLSGPGDVEAALRAAKALETLGENEEAIELLRRAERTSPHPGLAAERARLLNPP
jgi:tetratricopeptide (TPR) repeat protein